MLDLRSFTLIKPYFGPFRSILTLLTFKSRNCRNLHQNYDKDESFTLYPLQEEGFPFYNI
jgi:hypothetical protein